MTPAARLQAAIEIVDEVVEAARRGGAAADTVIAAYFRTRRYAGSKDRRAVRDLVYAAIRRTGEIPQGGRAALIGLAGAQPDLLPLFGGGPHAPAPIDPDEPIADRGVAPAWLIDRLGGQDSAALEALLARAPLDLRANRLKTTRDAMLVALPGSEPGRWSPDALRLPEGTQIERLPEWEAGKIEVQDEGSQLIVDACRPAPGMTIVDLCAGAGGKTLALAAAMAGTGRLIACDVDRARLGRMAPRAARAGVEAIETRLLDGGREAAGLADLAGQADIVLVDAPCSGTGTWRRNPEARWRLTPERLTRLRALQAHVLALAAPLVRPGGRLVYAVCSLLDEEGAAQVTAFIAAQPGWTILPDEIAAGRVVGPGRLLSPAADGTDGFFVAALSRS